MYWLGLQPGDVHLNISSPGWAKHAWSCFFAPWIAGATRWSYNYARFDAGGAARRARQRGGHHASARRPPSGGCSSRRSGRGRRRLRELVAAGEPLNPEVIEQVAAAWGLTFATATARPRPPRRSATRPARPSSPVRWAGRCPATQVALVDADRQPGDGGRDLPGPGQAPARPDARLPGRPERAAAAMAAASTTPATWPPATPDGYFTYIGRTDDVFKASDYRISPFELESVADRAPGRGRGRRRAQPRSAPARGAQGLRAARRRATSPPRDGAGDPAFAARNGSRPTSAIRRLEFAELPKTISGKIRRVQLRALETERHGPADDQPPAPAPRPRPATTAATWAMCATTGSAAAGTAVPRGPAEFWEEDFPDLKR